jgi:hypothetical protein
MSEQLGDNRARALAPYMATQRLTRTIKQALALATILLAGLSFNTYGYNSGGSEDRCDALGAVCFCSEPFNTQTYAHIGCCDNNPADTTAKQCNYSGSSGNAIEMFNDAGGNELPIGAPLQSSVLPNKKAEALYYLRGNRNGNGTGNNGGTGHFSFNVGDRSVAPAGKQEKICARWYLYHSDTRRGDAQNHWFGQGDGTSCQQATKMIHGSGWQNGNSYITSNNAERTIETDGWINSFWGTSGGVLSSSPLWSPAGQLACGPGTSNLWCGNWIRLEMCADKAAGASNNDGARFRLYWKNITDNTPERLIMDTYADGPDNASHAANGNQNLLIGSVYSDFGLNNYRQATSSQGCQGWRGVSHYMIATWGASDLSPGYDQFSNASTELDCGLNCKNRIGAAAELEGGGGPRPMPPSLQVQ